MTSRQCDLHQGLLELIEYQNQVITKQKELIAQLVNDTSEQENLIGVLMREQD